MRINRERKGPLPSVSWIYKINYNNKFRERGSLQARVAHPLLNGNPKGTTGLMLQ